MIKKYFGHNRSNMLPFVPLSATRILEVGCAAGLFGEQIKLRQNAFYWGIEPDAMAAEIALAKLDRVTNAYFDENFDAEGNRFDCIIFNDVLEHVIDPWRILRLTTGLLSENGTVVASIPNFIYYPNLKEIILTKDWQYKDSGTLDITHFRFFTRKSMIRMFESCEFKVVSCTGINKSKSRLLKVANALSFGRLEDFRYLQFALVAMLKNK